MQLILSVQYMKNQALCFHFCCIVADALKEFGKMIDGIEDERDRMVKPHCLISMLKYFVLIVKCLLKKLKYIRTTLFYQLNHANAQLIRPLETFRKEQIGGAKVGTPIYVEGLFLLFEEL